MNFSGQAQHISLKIEPQIHQRRHLMHKIFNNTTSHQGGFHRTSLLNSSTHRAILQQRIGKRTVKVVSQGEEEARRECRFPACVQRLGENGVNSRLIQYACLFMGEWRAFGSFYLMYRLHVLDCYREVSELKQ